MSKHKKQGRWLYEFVDETSMFDPKGQWCYGSEVCRRVYRAWVPNAIDKDDTQGLEDYLDKHPQAFIKS